MENWRHVWPVETICRVMRVSPRGYRSWRTRPISQRARTDMSVLAHIREQYSLSLGSYGRPRMTMELKEAGLAIGERRVGRLMKINGIKPVRTRRHKVTTDSHHRLGVAANWLDGDFVAAAPNQKWAGDITYVWTREGWVYLAVIIDLFSRRVVGWAISNRMKQDLALRALNMAIAIRRPPPGCIHHTDRGSQYCAHDYQKLLRKHGFKVSMSGKGNCYDNSAVESDICLLIFGQKMPKHCVAGRLFISDKINFCRNMRVIADDAFQKAIIVFWAASGCGLRSDVDFANRTAARIPRFGNVFYNQIYTSNIKP